MSDRVFGRRRFIQGAVGASAALATPVRLFAGSSTPAAGTSASAVPGDRPLTVAKRFAPIVPRFPHILHGGDYYPDQWLDRPDILQEAARRAESSRMSPLTGRC